MWKTGHSLIKAKMKQEHAALAGEMSGHMFFADRYHGFDDALIAPPIVVYRVADVIDVDQLCDQQADGHYGQAEAHAVLYWLRQCMTLGQGHHAH